MSMNDIGKAGHELPHYDMISIIRLLVPYLDEGRLNDVIAICHKRREELKSEALRRLNDETGWWKPKSIDEVMTDDAKVLALGIFRPVLNPEGRPNKIQAIRYLRAQTGVLLKDAKDAVETYVYCVGTNRIAFPEDLLWDGEETNNG